MAQLIRIINFEKFQHYTDRRPPWIKLYRDLWDDPRFFDLPNDERYLLIGLFVLASQHENKLEIKQEWLKAKLLTKKAIPIQKLIDTGWIEYVEQDASNTLAASAAQASGKQDDSPHAHAENTETEVQRQNTEKNIYIQHGEFGHCRLTVEESEKLRVKLGSQMPVYIDRFDRWLEENPSKRKSRHAYPSILNWWDKDGKPGSVNVNTPHKYTPEEIAEATAKLRAGGMRI